ncbi:MAG: DUF4430 domain-containing protein [Thermofilaceae archaeon]|nr:DUF4430 domain-containing protein [Thermofilaceae archaeon]MCX8180271.1 DUF4430 domain-containing protein [Thermofilaceae archaeon]MDW8004009.1 DUF4430 domain-containing protein [Thermofilaceae archaeon]
MPESSTKVSGSSKVIEILLVIILAWAVIASGFAAYAYMRAQSLEAELTPLRVALASTESELKSLRAKIVVVNVAIDYGNGTIKWYNSTPLPQGATVLKALLVTASRVEYTLGQYGAYVTSINGVSEKILSSTEGYSWLWYIFEGGQWVMGPVASDQYVVKDGDTLMWRYEHWRF